VATGGITFMRGEASNGNATRDHGGFWASRSGVSEEAAQENGRPAA
jgi:hypothetical protein